MLGICLFVIAAADPGLIDSQDAAARTAAGLAAEDASRESRARTAHWAPQLRAQGTLRESDQNRAGVRYGAPLVEEDIGAVQTWAVILTWDLAQTVFAREETQLALAHSRLAQLRREARGKAAELWTDRQRESARLSLLPPGADRASQCLFVLRLTAQLDALTGGLFREAVQREEVSCARAAEKR